MIYFLEGLIFLIQASVMSQKTIGSSVVAEEVDICGSNSKYFFIIDKRIFYKGNKTFSPAILPFLLLPLTSEVPRYLCAKRCLN